MHQIGTKNGSTWVRDYYHQGSSEPTWQDLVGSGLECYDWLLSNHSAICFTGKSGTCLVATLCALESSNSTTARYRIFQSTIPRVDQHDKLKRDGARDAPVWWAAFQKHPKKTEDGRLKFHAEDSAIFNFERAHYSNYPEVTQEPLRLVVVGTMFRADGTKPPGSIQDLCVSCEESSQVLRILVLKKSGAILDRGRREAERQDREEQERERQRQRQEEEELERQQSALYSDDDLFGDSGIDQATGEVVMGDGTRYYHRFQHPVPSWPGPGGPAPAHGRAEPTLSSFPTTRLAPVCLAFLVLVTVTF